MRLIHSDFKKGKTKIKIETLDDLWYLSHLIDEGDFIKGKTLRKIKLSQAEERTTKTIKKPVFLQIQVEKVEFHHYANILRASGKITQGSEEVPRGSHHTFNLEINTEITLEKEKWLTYQKKQLKEATQIKRAPILICLHDREDALLALTKHPGYTILTKLHGQVPKKEVKVITKKNFYQEIIQIIKEYSLRYKTENIILASPAFYKEDLMKLLTDPKLKKKIVLATCSSVKETAINEVLKRPEVKATLAQNRIAQETALVEELLTQISKNGPAAYGFKEIKKAIQAGAVAQLLVSDSLIQQLRKKEKYKELDQLMKQVDQMKGSIHILTSEYEPGKKLNGLGGIAALLRFKLEW